MTRKERDKLFKIDMQYMVETTDWDRGLDVKDRDLSSNTSLPHEFLVPARPIDLEIYLAIEVERRHIPTHLETRHYLVHNARPCHNRVWPTSVDLATPTEPRSLFCGGISCFFTMTIEDVKKMSPQAIRSTFCLAVPNESLAWPNMIDWVSGPESTTQYLKERAMSRGDIIRTVLSRVFEYREAWRAEFPVSY